MEQINGFITAGLQIHSHKYILNWVLYCSAQDSQCLCLRLTLNRVSTMTTFKKSITFDYRFFSLMAFDTILCMKETEKNRDSEIQKENRD